MKVLALVLLVSCGRDELLRSYRSRPADTQTPVPPKVVCPEAFVDRAIFREAPGMNERRSAHTATLLEDGRVLIAGGVGVRASGTSSAEIFDPESGRWVPTREMREDRILHDAARLADGRVLVAGGLGEEVLRTSEIYDPIADTWTPAGSMLRPRYGLTLVTLDDGRVLAVGGFSTDIPLDIAEIFDPVTGAFREVSAPRRRRAYHTATKLGDGRVLVAGGFMEVTSAETFDPLSMTWTLTSEMRRGHELHAAVLLEDASVLIAGGNSDAVERYNVVGDVFQPLPPMTGPRASHTATRLCSGDVLVVGGGPENAEVFDRRKGRWIATPRLRAPKRTFHTATPLLDGRVLVAGGVTDDLLSFAELYGVTSE